MKRWIALGCGTLFGVGLALSGMTHPDRVLAFLDVAGIWNPGLLFVLGGAVSVAFIGFRWVLHRPAPWCAPAFYLPVLSKPDRALLAGSLLFGIGWGISGYCPGPAVALLAAPNDELLVFLPALLVGGGLCRLLHGASH